MKKQKMTSYETLQNISATLYLDLKDETDVQNRLEDSIQTIHSQISHDFNKLFGHKLNLRDFHIYVDDETYRQSATGIILNETISNYENLKIRFECLIDHGKIWVKVKEGKESPDLKQIVKRIEKLQNVEGLIELKDIK